MQYLRLSKNFLLIILVINIILFSSCAEFLNPDQDIYITEDQLLDDWQEYRALEMGLYGLQQDLAEQIVILGELRGDLMKITDNADADLVEIYNFNVSGDNKYASPRNFFKLISASNNFIYLLEKEHPEVQDPNAPITNYDRLYGEALCMRAWAYFNAGRIYGKVPFIHESLTSIEEVESFLNSSGTYVDSVDIIYGRDGYHNDTVYNNEITLDKQYYNLDLIIDYFTNDLTTKVKAVGVNHSIDNDDNSWQVTIWNSFAMDALLGQMYLTDGNYSDAVYHFEQITNFYSEDNRYQLDETFDYGNWKSIFTGIDLREHIYVMWFNKSYMQQNKLQELFESVSPHKYMVKPTYRAVLNFESVFRNWKYESGYADMPPSEVDIDVRNFTYPNKPGDLYRGYNISYSYLLNGEPLDEDLISDMLEYKKSGDFNSARNILENCDTAVWKYSLNKDIFDQDANFIVYRASGIHFWLAEIYNWWYHEENGKLSTYGTRAIKIINDGSQYDDDENIRHGIRERVGLYAGEQFPYTGIRGIENIIYLHDPFNNEVIDYKDLTGDFLGKQKFIEEEILTEKARELAFEGERFYDLMRIAKRRDDPSFLASRVSEKYPPGKREEIYKYLLNEDNWYINYFK